MVVGVGTKITNGSQLFIADPSFGSSATARSLGIDYFVWIFIGFALVCGFILSRTEARPLALRDRRQPRGGAALRHQHPRRPDRRIRLQRLRRRRRGSHLRLAYRDGDRRQRDRATSSFPPSQPSSSAARASREAAGRSGGPCSASSSSSSSGTGSTCSRSIRTSSQSSRAGSSSPPSAIDSLSRYRA